MQYQAGSLAFLIMKWEDDYELNYDSIYNQYIRIYTSLLIVYGSGENVS